MELGLGRTNATKAVIGGLVSAALALATAFGFDLSGEQVGAINAFVDALLIGWIALSYKESPKRIENEQLVAAIKDVDPPAEVLVTEDEPS
jgi:hypothetical protein